MMLDNAAWDPPPLRRSAHDDDRGLWELFGKMEHEGLDFKESANHLTDAIAAMSMTEGGMLVIGNQRPT